jgi:hypothetical protein
MKTTMATRFALVLGLVSLALAVSAEAMDLDWAGQFRAESHWVHNYALDSSATDFSAGGGGSGYSIAKGGEKTAQFQTLFLRLKPKLTVNDNVYIKSEWWLGDPVFGLFGDSAPYTRDQKNWYSTQSRGATIRAQRFYGEFITDVGTVDVGRAPLNYGLGLVWSSGDGLWDRYESTGDQIRLLAKFGAFTVSPAAVKYSMGNTIGGACNGATCTPAAGGGGLSDYSLLFKYENPDEDFEGGVNFIKRVAGGSQDATSGYFTLNSAPGGMNFNTWDLYGKKTLGRFSIAGEVPIVSGDLSGVSYKTWAAALEAGWKMNDSWETQVRAGHAPGQPNSTSARPDRFEAFYFNPNYKPALILFNYQLANFARAQTLNNSATDPASLASPYDNPVTNANYLTLGLGYKTDKWRFSGKYVFANAVETCTAGTQCFNTWRRTYEASTASQSSSLGWEMDYGASLQWDENFVFGLDLGWYFPGDFYKYSNAASENSLSSVFATVFRVGVNF